MDAIGLAVKLREFAEAYGTAVRAGVITPNIDDEKAVRAMFGLPDVNADVVAEWARTNGVRTPITLSQSDTASGAELAAE